MTWGGRPAGHMRGLTRGAFLHEARPQDAARRCVAVLGGTARFLIAADPGIAARHPGLRLRGAYGARDRRVHDHLGADHGTVWVAATESAPASAATARQPPGG